MPATTKTATSRRRTDLARKARDEARDELWRAGDLSWMLDYGRPSGPQRDFYEKSKASPRKTFVSEDARRLGKSVALVIIAFELALKNPGCRINWCQDTSKGVRSSAIKTMEKLARKAPPDCKGKFNQQLSSFVFPNGAYIFIFGGNTEEDADTARGGDDPIASFFDEAGFMRFLKYIYKSIVKPGMRLVKRVGHFGMIFVSSSTPEEPDHFFIQLADLNAIHGSYVRRTIYATPDAERFIAEEAAEAGMTVEEYKRTDDFLRELMCERVINKDVVVFPEFAEHRETVVREWERPPGFEPFIYKRISADLGGIRDKYGLLWGYVDFRAGKLVIEDESLLDKPNTEDLAAEIVLKTSALWPELALNRIDIVIDDDTERTIRDLWDLHGIRATKAIKQGPSGGRASAIGMVRTYLRMGALAIHPRCKRLQAQLLTARRNKQGTDFERTETGHSDLCAALMYWCRDIPLNRNPYPPEWSEAAGRSLPAEHPLVARREALRGTQPRGLAGAIMGHNAYTGAQRR